MATLCCGAVWFWQGELNRTDRQPHLPTLVPKTLLPGSIPSTWSPDEKASGGSEYEATPVSHRDATADDNLAERQRFADRACG